MNISKDGKTLYFSDEEIDNETNGQKRVFVTKRINGQESHIKVEKRKRNPIENKKEIDIEKNNTDKIDNEIIIDVNTIEKNNIENENNIKENIDKIKKKKRRKHSKHGKHNGKNNQHIKDNEQKNTSSGKKVKNKKSSKKIATIFSLIILVAMIIVFLLAAPIFNINNIKVEGNEKVSAEEIISLSQLKKGENIFKFNNSIISNIKQNKYIENVTITRKLPDTVKITVEERKIKYQINLINSFAYIDKNGYILENSTVKKEVPVIAGLSITENELLNKERLDSEDLQKINKIIKIMDATKAINISDIITEINTENENDYIIYVESKNKKIHIGNTSNLTNKMLYVKKILENEEGKSGEVFVNGDINSGFKPYFREE